MKIAVLGPKGTYSDIAASKYIAAMKLDIEKEYYSTIIKTVKAVSDDTIAIVPFENTLDGFVLESLDQMIVNKLTICDQLKLSIDFAFVTNAPSIESVTTVYCQFKAYGQCLDFITEHDFTVIKTDSNVQSADLLDSASDSFGAIIPMHLLEERKFKTVIPHVADSKNNETRFFILKKKEDFQNTSGLLNTSIVVFSKEDRPGLLFEILKQFHELDINLNSIMSRPSKEEMGKYNFYMECTLKDTDLKKLDVLIAVMESEGFKLQVLGVYNTLV